MGVAMLQGAWPPSAGESLVHHTTPPVVWGAEPQRGGDCLPLGLRTPSFELWEESPASAPFLPFCLRPCFSGPALGFCVWFPCSFLPSLSWPFIASYPIHDPMLSPRLPAPGLLSQLLCETRAFDPRDPRSVSSLSLTFKKIIIKRKVTRLLVSPVGREMRLSHNRFGETKSYHYCVLILFAQSLRNRDGHRSWTDEEIATQTTYLA